MALKMMGVEKFVEQNFPIECKGRDSRGNEVLSEPVKVVVNIHKSPGSNDISSNVRCQYNSGGHGQKCDASGSDNAGCPYAFDLPYALEVRRG